VHGYLGIEPLAEVSRVTVMVGVPVGHNDELEVSKLAARGLQLTCEVVACARADRMMILSDASAIFFSPFISC
jgi:hypothetical protein